MNYIHLNKFLNIPLYLQLKDCIKEAILTGELNDKEKLPTEEAICAVFNISRPVVRQAFNELIKEGLITRIQGKGSFVHKKLMMSNLMYTAYGYANEVRKYGLEPESTIFSKEIDKREKIRRYEKRAHRESFFRCERYSQNRTTGLRPWKCNSSVSYTNLCAIYSITITDNWYMRHLPFQGKVKIGLRPFFPNPPKSKSLRFPEIPVAITLLDDARRLE